MFSGKSISILLVATALPALAAEPTFYKDVLRILQSHCQECHRPGEMGPMSLQTYQQVRPLAAAIKEQVLLKQMPPWDADPHVGKFANDRSLSQAEIETLAGWASTGAKEGNKADAPAPRHFTEGWNIGKPDIELKMPKPFPVPAQGEVDYQYIVIPAPFKEDTWVTAAEFRPQARSVVHHALVYIREPGNKWLRGEAEPGVPFSTKDGLKRGDTGGAGNDILITYTPGVAPEVWREGQGKLIPAGSDLVLQMHYTTNGKVTEDQTSVGLVLAKTPPKGAHCFRICVEHPAGDSSRCAQLRGGRALYVPASRDHQPVAAPHACTGQGFRIPDHLAGRPHRDAAEGAELPFQLAAFL